MIKIRLFPCYPEGQSLGMQIEKLEEEFEETITAKELDKASECLGKASEYLDLAQVATGLLDIAGDNNYIHDYTLKELRRYNIIFKDNLYREVGMYSYLILGDKYEDILAHRLVTRCLTAVYRLCKEYGEECGVDHTFVLSNLLTDHRNKLESRRKEWANEELRKECRYIEGYCSYCGGCNAES